MNIFRRFSVLHVMATKKFRRSDKDDTFGRNYSRTICEKRDFDATILCNEIAINAIFFHYK